MSRFTHGYLVITEMIFFIKWPWALCHLGYSDHSKTEEDQNYSWESSILSLLKGEKEKKKSFTFVIITIDRFRKIPNFTSCQAYGYGCKFSKIVILLESSNFIVGDKYCQLYSLKAHLIHFQNNVYPVSKSEKPWFFC